MCPLLPRVFVVFVVCPFCAPSGFSRLVSFFWPLLSFSASLILSRLVFCLYSLSVSLKNKNFRPGVSSIGSSPSMSASELPRPHALPKDHLDRATQELVESPLYRQQSVWRRHLASYPEQAVRGRVLDGIQNGFSIRATGGIKLQPASRNNHKSAEEDPAFIAQRIQEELDLGRYLYIPKAHSSMVLVAPIGLVPKQPTGFRLIHDLSAGYESSVNAAIDKEDARTNYGTIAQAVDHIQKLGSDVYLAKIDFKDAFRHCRVRPDEVHLLGLHFRGKTYVDLCLPFGLRTSPAVFNELAHVAMWIASQVARALHPRVQFAIVHYLDDFLLVCLGLNPARHVMATVMNTFTELGLLVNDKKCVDPSKELTFLGVELDVAARVVRLPKQKQLALVDVVGGALAKTSFTQRELLSIAGQLFAAAKVVKPGRTFTSSLMLWAYKVRHLYEVVRPPPSSQLYDDLRWWQRLLLDWNGVTFIEYLPASAGRDLHLHVKVGSDASSTVGYGLLCGDEWAYGRWTERSNDLPIHVKELIPLVLAAMLWGNRWSRRQVIFECDNMAVVLVVNDGYPKDPKLRHYLRHLWLCAIRCGFTFSAVHVRGVTNTDADDLSRGKISDFLSRHPNRSNRQVTVTREHVEALQL